jgi:hypothetical protein
MLLFGTVTQPTAPRRPPGYRQPQIVADATLRKGRRGWLLTFKLPRILRLLELSCLVAIPTDMVEGARSPVYVRFFLDAGAEDTPGSIVID